MRRLRRRGSRPPKSEEGAPASFSLISPSFHISIYLAYLASALGPGRMYRPVSCALASSSFICCCCYFCFLLNRPFHCINVRLAYSIFLNEQHQCSPPACVRAAYPSFLLSTTRASPPLLERQLVPPRLSIRLFPPSLPVGRGVCVLSPIQIYKHMSPAATLGSTLPLSPLLPLRR